ncbi:hypothetical protein WDH52_20060 [Streptomyces sp. TRM70308]|uniref:hypothetical protein n=1 Tax=Streptomyces TaxID=1883 RepID=UPI0022492405|nr:hypothetical protein [Streptomyces sp. JHD 1]MCX2967913.1 hypothetical protein [Streptomyces sp. JHD 1]
MTKVSVSLDAELAVEAMVLSGTRSPQDALELIVRDYVARGHRTEARTGNVEDELHRVRDLRPDAETGA